MGLQIGWWEAISGLIQTVLAAQARGPLAGIKNMKSSGLIFAAWAVCGLGIFSTMIPRARAEFIQPVAVTVTNGEGSQEALINGGGFDDSPEGSPASIHNTNGGEMWSGVGSIRESAIFDLGKTVSLTKVYIWNYNAPNATDVGMKEAEVQVSSGTDMATAVFNTIAKIALKEGGEAAQVFDVAGTSVRLVKLKGLSNWGQGFTVGLAEARFESGEITGNVPTITVNSPHDGDEIAFGTDVTFDVRVVDRDGDLQKVEIFDGETLVTNKTTPTFTAALKAPAKGEHAYRVLATDRSGKAAWVTVNLNIRELVADRIVKIDDTEDEGTGPNQIRYQGTWTLAQGNANDPRYKNNDHYNLGTGRTDFFEVRFTGVKIDLFGTVASHHGSAFASIDGGPEAKVNYKQTQRKEQVFVWGSPILANREHVLKVRTSGDGVVTADRFDISVSDKPDLATAAIQSVSFNQVVVRMEDVGASVVDETSLKMTLDSAPVVITPVKAGSATTITYSPLVPFAPGSSHVLKIEGKDKAGAALNSELAFNLPAPFFPLTGLGGPEGAAGSWGLRQIWGGGRADAVVTASAIALQANQAGFAGKLDDVQAPFINFALSSNPGGGGLFQGDEPLPAELKDLAVSDFVVLARATVRIPRAGDWTIGVHSDDGFALRFVGRPFELVSGAGVRDDNFPEYMGFLTETGDGNTRGILRGLPAGDYGIQFVGFQRTGGANYEIYAAEGAFENDADTETWQLIGVAGGLELVAAPMPQVEFKVLQVSKTGESVTIQFQSSHPEANHRVQQSANLRDWAPAAGAGAITALGGGAYRITVSGASAKAAFYKIGAQ